MAGQLTVSVISPERTVYEGTADQVVAPAWDGEIGILRGHAPALLLLGTGERNAPPPRQVREALHRAGIGLEFMDTPTAARLYNVLTAEGRRVAAALIAVWSFEPAAKRPIRSPSGQDSEGKSWLDYSPISATP